LLLNIYEGKNKSRTQHEEGEQMSRAVLTEETVGTTAYIDGQWTTGDSSNSFEVRSPIDGKLLARVPEASASDVDRAVTAAVRAFRELHLTPYERYEILSRAATLIKKRFDEFATLIVEEAGKPIRDARVEVMRAIQCYTLAAEEAKRIHGEVVPLDATPGSENRFGFTLRAPVGVVCAITPFNAPLNQMNHKVPTAIAVGDTVVLKPAEVCPLSAIAAVQVLEEAGLPPGVVNLLHGPGETVGELLLRDPRINLFTFTGSAAVGKHIHDTVGLRRTLLELGSNSATIIHRDADLDRAATACAKGGFVYAGQLCISVQRVLVHEDVLPGFLDKFVAKVRSLVLGNPRDERSDVGPMISEEAAERAERWIAQTVAAGATLHTGGTRQGNYLTPTVLTGVSTDQPVWCEEAFAPVVVIAPYRDFDDALARANDSPYGLQAGVFTESMDVAFRAARRLDVGGVIINDVPTYRVDSMPYGGIKRSGMGREGIRYAMEELTETRMVVLNLRERLV
jgi:acyl-CoA reductase-like NAD-dependent aldehyde dehydrogenase